MQIQTRSPTEPGSTPWADGVDDAGAVLVRDLPVRSRRRRCRPGLPVGRVHAGDGEPDADLAGAGLGDRAVGELEDVGTTRPAIGDGAHRAVLPPSAPGHIRFSCAVAGPTLSGVNGLVGPPVGAAPDRRFPGPHSCARAGAPRWRPCRRRFPWELRLSRRRLRTPWLLAVVPLTVAAVLSGAVPAGAGPTTERRSSARSACSRRTPSTRRTTRTSTATPTTALARRGEHRGGVLTPRRVGGRLCAGPADRRRHAAPHR